MGDGEEGKRKEKIKQEECKDLCHTISSNRDVL